MDDPSTQGAVEGFGLTFISQDFMTHRLGDSAGGFDRAGRSAGAGSVRVRQQFTY